MNTDELDLRLARPNFRGVSMPFRRICLCGSTRFKRAWIEWNIRLTLEVPAIVYSVAAFQQDIAHPLTHDQKQLLDYLHKEKIRNSDEIFVLNVGGYYGESTTQEIAFARRLGRPVIFLDDFFPGWTESNCVHVKG